MIQEPIDSIFLYDVITYKGKRYIVSEIEDNSIICETEINYSAKDGRTSTTIKLTGDEPGIKVVYKYPWTNLDGSSQRL